MPADGVDGLLDRVAGEVVRWRRHLHANPELSFHEERTSEFIAETLQGFGGLEIDRPAGTSVVARLRGTAGGPVVALRADIDALPIREENEVSYASRNPGVMHACGHDGHTAMLLGAAKVLGQLRERVRGEVRFIFQQAEELFPGGAEALCDAGVMDGVQAVVGAHLWTPLEVGRIGIRAGAMMAAPDTFRIVIRGRGGHAAQPDATVDSVVVAAEAVVNLQHIVARRQDPLKPLVVSVTSVHGGTADNIIPDAVELLGTVRSFDAEERERVPQAMREIVGGICAAHGATFEFEYQKGYRPVRNDPHITGLVREAVAQRLGADAVVEPPPSMGGEDFSAYQVHAPGCFFLVGAGNPARGITHPHHSSRFDIDEDALRLGLGAEVDAALHLLEALDLGER